ncbi:hypothetical protein N7452_000717, partial [Penicillium brevicompactum]
RWVSVVSASGFANTCENISSSGTTLRADCLGAGTGQLQTSTIDINCCLSNSNGNLRVLTIISGGYSGSCKSCALQGSTGLTWQCRNTSGQFVTTTQDLNNCVTNSNGRLTC